MKLKTIVLSGTENQPFETVQKPMISFSKFLLPKKFVTKSVFLTLDPEVMVVILDYLLHGLLYFRVISLTLHLLLPF